MTPVARVLGVAVAALLTAGLVLGSALPYTDTSEGVALVRLSWRAVGERVEECRAPTAEELAELPLHMRQREICEARLSPFHLRVSIDGARVFEGEVRAAGAREDRPAYVFQEYPVAPGEHRLEIRFAATGAGTPARPPLTLDRRVALAPREILLVTHEPEADRLSLRGGRR